MTPREFCTSGIRLIALLLVIIGIVTGLSQFLQWISISSIVPGADEVNFEEYDVSYVVASFYGLAASVPMIGIGLALWGFSTPLGRWMSRDLGPRPGNDRGTGASEP